MATNMEILNEALKSEKSTLSNLAAERAVIEAKEQASSNRLYEIWFTKHYRLKDQLDYQNDQEALKDLAEYALSGPGIGILRNWLASFVTDTPISETFFSWSRKRNEGLPIPYISFMDETSENFEKAAEDIVKLADSLAIEGKASFCFFLNGLKGKEISGDLTFFTETGAVQATNFSGERCWDEEINYSDVVEAASLDALLKKLHEEN